MGAMRGREWEACAVGAESVSGYEWLCGVWAQLCVPSQCRACMCAALPRTCVCSRVALWASCGALWACRERSNPSAPTPRYSCLPHSTSIRGVRDRGVLPGVCAFEC